LLVKSTAIPSNLTKHIEEPSLLMASFTALLLGATVAIAIGPIALLIVNASASAGLGTGVSSAFGAAIGDFTFALVAFLAGSLATSVLIAHKHVISMLGSLVLLAFGIWVILRALRGTIQVRQVLPQGFLARPLQTTYVLTLLNPLTILAFAGFAPLFNPVRAPELAIWHALCVGLGSLAVQLTLALGGAGLGRLLRIERSLQLLNFISGIGIAGFGIAGLLR
jgi:threonine/homoserine/homoserine lactone efflux protein